MCVANKSLAKVTKLTHALKKCASMHIISNVGLQRTRLQGQSASWCSSHIEFVLRLIMRLLKLLCLVTGADMLSSVELGSLNKLPSPSLKSVRSFSFLSPQFIEKEDFGTLV